MSFSEYIFLAASSLFVIVDPLAAVPAFLAMTPTDTPEQRTKMARLACCVAAGVLLAFAIAGKWIYEHHRAHHGPAPGGNSDSVHTQRSPATQSGPVPNYSLSSTDLLPILFGGESLHILQNSACMGEKLRHD
jgi:MarC family integral membrane protein